MPAPVTDSFEERLPVVGGGLAGLACGWQLARQGQPVHVLEASARAGGVVGSRRQEGFLFEAGPHTLPATAETFRRVAADLGLADRLIGSSDSARTRWLYHKGKLHPVPLKPQELLSSKLLSTRAKLRLASEPLRPFRDPGPGNEPTLRQLLVERLGEEITDRFAGAFVRGIYAGDHGRLGARSAFPKLWSLLEEHGSLLKGLGKRAKQAAERERQLPGPSVGPGRLLSFPEGLGTLVEGLAQGLGSRLRLSTPVNSVRRTGRGFVLSIGHEGGGASGAEWPAERVVLATPARTTAQLLGQILRADERAFLEGLECSSVRLVHLGFAPGTLELPEGFGFLVPPEERGPDAPELLGALFASNLFPGRAPAGGSSVACFYALENVAALTEQALLERARRDLRRAIESDVPEPATSWVLTWQGAIPQLAPRHAERMAALEERLAREVPGLVLAGAWTRGVAVDDVLRGGLDAAERVQRLGAVPPTRPVAGSTG
jgi:oxygen-dependent protoporphyrinogen oxidase